MSESFDNPEGDTDSEDLTAHDAWKSMCESLLNLMITTGMVMQVLHSDAEEGFKGLMGQMKTWSQQMIEETIGFGEALDEEEDDSDFEGKYEG